MSIESYVATLNGALETITSALDVLRGGLVQTDDARTLLGDMLRGTTDPDAGRLDAEFGSAHNAMAHAHSTVAALGPRLRTYIAAITDGQGTSTSVAPARAPDVPSPQRTATGATEVSQERVAELRRELPPDIVPHDQRPPGTPQPKTHGRWVEPDGTTHTAVSARDQQYRETVDWFESRGMRIPTRASDIEMKLAVHMRMNGIRSVTLAINHVPCEGELSCDTLLPQILPKGYTMTVHGAGGFHKTYKGESVA
ncbi:MAG TPA: DddA-like double-stranded DNA deaminase toxin [Actinokineospora sp.]|nr:DddA-like double-stranded DNA deaminase toxin [Actinokineospora sp.]